MIPFWLFGVTNGLAFSVFMGLTFLIAGVVVIFYVSPDARTDDDDAMIAIALAWYAIFCGTLMISLGQYGTTFAVSLSGLIFIFSSTIVLGDSIKKLKRYARKD